MSIAPESTDAPSAGWPENADLRVVTGAVPALISFFDADHVCRFANDYHIRWYGRTPEELVGLHMREFLGEAGYQKRRPFLEQVGRGEMVSFDAAVPHRDGSAREAAIRYVPRLGAQGFEGFYVLVFDVAVHQHRFHSVFDGAAIAFWELDLTGLNAMLAELSADGVRDFAGYFAEHPDFVRRALDATYVIDLNSKATSLFGVARDATIGQPFARWCLPESVPALTANLVAYVSQARSYEAQTRFRREDGAGFPALLTCAFPRQARERNAFIVGISDITALMQKEEELARLQTDLAHAARVATLGELAASIAHEVNQPLAAVAANGNAALRWLRRDEPDIGEAMLALQRIIGEASRASQIIQRTRALAAKKAPERQWFAPNLMIEESIEVVRRQILGLGAELELDLEPAAPEILGDRIQLQQVTINLLVNAAQAMAAAESPARTIRVRSRAEDEQFVVAVADSGPGIEPAEAGQVFNAFYSTKSTGMGMGLSVAKTIVEAHGGAIELRSQPGEGAEFRYSLPLQHTQV